MAISDWYQVKLFLEHASRVSMDALHVIAGFIIFMLAGMFSKRGLASPLPLLALLLLEVANEAYDLHVERWPEPSMQYGEGIKDIVLTILLPTLVFAVARWKPGLVIRRLGSPGD